MKKALVRSSDNSVVNVIKVGDSYQPPEGHYLADAGLNAEPGGTYTGGRFQRNQTPREPPIRKKGPQARYTELIEKRVDGVMAALSVDDPLTDEEKEELDTIKEKLGGSSVAQPSLLKGKLI